MPETSDDILGQTLSTSWSVKVKGAKADAAMQWYAPVPTR